MFEKRPSFSRAMMPNHMPFLTITHTLRTTLFGPKCQDDWTDSYLRAEDLSGLLDLVEDDVDVVLVELSSKRRGTLDTLLTEVRISL
jgi:hypothetical protein